MPFFRYVAHCFNRAQAQQFGPGRNSAGKAGRRVRATPEPAVHFGYAKLSNSYDYNLSVKTYAAHLSSARRLVWRQQRIVSGNIAARNNVIAELEPSVSNKFSSWFFVDANCYRRINALCCKPTLRGRSLDQAICAPRQPVRDTRNRPADQFHSRDSKSWLLVIFA